MKGYLDRIAYLEWCTLGYLCIGTLKLATIEPPWIPNPFGPGGKSFVSCVPDGTYTVQPHLGEFDGYALINHEIGVYLNKSDIPAGQKWGRDIVKIHEGNWVKNSIGCVIVGEKHGFMGSQNAVLSSVVAMNKLRSVLGKSSHEITIRPMLGTVELAA